MHQSSDIAEEARILFTKRAVPEDMGTYLRILFEVGPILLIVTESMFIFLVTICDN